MLADVMQHLIPTYSMGAQSREDCVINSLSIELWSIYPSLALSLNCVPCLLNNLSLMPVFAATVAPPELEYYYGLRLFFDNLTYSTTCKRLFLNFETVICFTYITK